MTGGTASAADLEPKVCAAAGPSIPHMPALDGIRGLAVAAVLLYHGGSLAGGFLGVDAFFVLSGFLITSLLLGETRSSGRVNLRAFWSRRARRLLPALILVLFAVGLYATLVASRTELGQIRADSLATLGYVANWHSISAGNSYLELFQTPSPLTHTWSLAIEEQFYLVWPIVVFAIAAVAARRARSRDHVVATRVLWTALGLAAVSASLMILLYVPNRDPSRVYLGTDTRAASILLGAALAALLARRGPARSKQARTALEVAGFASVGVLAWAWITFSGDTPGLYRGGFLLCGLAATTVIAVAAHPEPSVLTRVLAVKPLRMLGIISYGVYLWHWPIYLVLDEERTGLDDAALLAVRIAATLAVSTISFFAIERPVRRGWPDARRVWVLAPAALAACLAAVIVSTEGARPPIQIASAPTHAPRTATTLPPVPTQPRLLVVGDSVGYFIGEEIVALQSELGVTTFNGTVGGCVFRKATQVRDVTDAASRILPPTECEQGWYAAARIFQPDEILLVHGSRSIFADVELDGQFRTACSEQFDTWYEEQLRLAVNHLAARGARVWIATLPHDTAKWVPADSHARADCENAAAKRVARTEPRVAILDLSAYICPADVCLELVDGRKLRPDGIHFEGVGADYVARWLVGEISRRSRLEASETTKAASG